jgi:hypothetical protein
LFGTFRRDEAGPEVLVGDATDGIDIARAIWIEPGDGCRVERRM